MTRFVPKTFRALLAVLLAVVPPLSPKTTHADQGTVTLLGQLSMPEDGLNADIWGWVDPSTGKEYALVGNSRNAGGFHIVDVTVPSNPTIVGKASGVSSFDLKAWGNYVYTTVGRRGLTAYVVDISDVTSPVVVGSFPSSHNIAVDDRGNMYNSNVGAVTEFAIYDIHTNPVSPALLWHDGLPDAHDATIVGNRLYLFHGALGTYIYDVTDPSSPVQLGLIDDLAIAYHHSGWPTSDGKYLYLCDELATGASPDITVWNIENPANPSKVAEIFDPYATVHNLYIIGGFAYVAYYKSGFRVYDVRDPENPTISAEFDTSPLTGEGYAGAFGCYPFAPSGNIYVNDEETGLYIFSFTPPQSAVAITRFEGAFDGGVVRLDWDIGSADGLAGFNIYRSRERDTGYTLQNVALIPPGNGFAYEDTAVEPGRTYWYQLGAIDRDGEFLSQRVAVTIPRQTITLHQNYPNPFNPTTTIGFTLPEAARVTLIVYNTQGQKIRTLVDGFENAGPHAVTWDGASDAAARVSSGVYYYRLEVSGRAQTRRMILLK